MSELNNLQKLVKELLTTNSSNEKKEILSRYPECKTLLYWIYNPLKQFNITSANVKKIKIEKHPDEIFFSDIFDMLTKLSMREITGHAAISSVKNFIHRNIDFEELIYFILDKDLKCRVDAKLINAVFPNHIPLFEVALAEKYEDYKSKIDFSKDVFLYSRKLDGVRVITIIDDAGNISFYSRQGKEFFTLDIIKNAIKEQSLPNAIVLDGEMCITDDSGNEDFTSIVKLIRKKDFTIPNPKYKIFDYLSLEIFNAHKGEIKLSDRLLTLKETIRENVYLEICHQEQIHSHEELKTLLDSAVQKGWEGLIIRKDGPYEGKRSKNMLKVKAFIDAEFIVKGIETGKIRFFENKQEIAEDMLSAIQIEYKGCQVSVGSGFTIDQRRYFFRHPEEIIGKTVTIKYFSESRNELGGYSLRFPILKQIYSEGRED